MAYWEAGGKSDDWYTPKAVFDALGCAFDMGVAAPASGIGTYVPTERWISEGSLSAEWSGFVWMNPPFGGRNGLGPWLDKFFLHGDGVALTPDRTSAPWFQAAWHRADGVLFTPKLRFLRPDGTEGASPSNGTALFASGDRGMAALSRAAKKGLGILALPLAAREVA